MSRLRLLQVCNVGEIVGGTTACAWTVTRALPEFDHVVAFLSDVSDEARTAFAGIRVERWPRCAPALIDRVRPDVVMLHNIPGRRRLSGAATLQYVHSAGRRAPADVTVYCSRWLARECGASERDVLYQSVPRPLRPASGRSRGSDGRLVIGRLCTPMGLKWPHGLISFYSRLATDCPLVEWEFVGCPRRLQAELANACGGRARFFGAGWDARRRFWEWDALLYHHPTLTESFGRTAAECMRAECVPIVDARGGFLEQLTPETGFPCATVEDFVASVARLHDQTVRRHVRRGGSVRIDGFRLRHFASGCWGGFGKPHC
ncbi:MAG: hypothetical protein U0992_00760 [Planctomycetaceae bacterium]